MSRERRDSLALIAWVALPVLILLALSVAAWLRRRRSAFDLCAKCGHVRLHHYDGRGHCGARALPTSDPWHLTLDEARERLEATFGKIGPCPCGWFRDPRKWRRPRGGRCPF